MTLPKFKYHPDPVATGSVEESDTECECCGQARGWIYVGPVYAEEEFDECICPWCIADGSAHERLDASFTDDESVGGAGSYGDCEVREFVDHYNAERFHQGLGGRLVRPPATTANDNSTSSVIHGRSRLGGLLTFYHREAA